MKINRKPTTYQLLLQLTCQPRFFSLPLTQKNSSGSLRVITCNKYNFKTYERSIDATNPQHLWKIYLQLLPISSLKQQPSVPLPVNHQTWNKICKNKKSMGMPPTLPNIPDAQPSQHWWIKMIPVVNSSTITIVKIELKIHDLSKLSSIGSRYILCC